MTMSEIQYSKYEKLFLNDHPVLDEKWVQDRIAEDPSILGLGDLVLKDKERIQPKAGRLDLLLQDPESDHRYEVEIQLGQTDEKHIIRTLEYWDIESKRYPQYDHTAVIIAEDITSRFFNVIGLFNGYIPIIAIQMNAIKIKNDVSLIFTTVLNEMRLGLVDEDEEVYEVADRGYWEQRATRETVSMADEVLDIINSFDTSLELKYNKFYIGLAKNDKPNNFVVLKPKKSNLRMEIKFPRSDEMDSKLEEVGLDIMDYDKRYGRYRIKVSKGEIKKYNEFLHDFLKDAYSGTA
jgi:predicted transport protein